MQKEVKEQKENQTKLAGPIVKTYFIEYLGPSAGFLPKFWWDKEIPLCSPSWRRGFVPCLPITVGLAGAIRKDLLRTKSACFIGSY